MADGHPNLNGLWQALVTANWDLQDHEAQPGLHPELEGAYDASPPGQTIVEGGEIPYQPWALQKKKENFANRGKVDVGNDETRQALGRRYPRGRRDRPARRVVVRPRGRFS